MKLKLVLTSDGSHTIFVPEMNEHYHSIHGAIRESEFIFLGKGYDFCPLSRVRIFEAGFGTGLNTLLTAVRAVEQNRKVVYTAIDKYPLPQSVISALNYPRFTGKNTEELFRLIHAATWGEPVAISENFTLIKIMGDLTASSLKGPFDLIYFDAFGPDKQPEMWSREIFEGVAAATSYGGIFVTYSAKGQVRRNLQAAGFTVTLLPGPPGKRQIIRAVKIEKNL